jgi:hypothetical protein
MNIWRAMNIFEKAIFCVLVGLVIVAATARYGGTCTDTSEACRQQDDLLMHLTEEISNIDASYVFDLFGRDDHQGSPTTTGR